MSASEKPRHPATAQVWEWLEEGEGRNRPEQQQASVRQSLETLDAEFLAWERELDTPTDSDGVCGCVREWMG